MFQIVVASLAAALPVAKNDLIQGQEFLSLYINSQPVSERLRRRQHNNHTEDTPSVSNNPSSADDDLQAAPSSYSAQYSRPATVSIDINAAPVDADYEDADEEELAGFRDFNKTKVVELVTTGSRIVFIEDDAEVERNDKRSHNNDVNQPSDEIKVTSISVSSSSKQTRRPEYKFPTFDQTDAHNSDGTRSSSLGRSQFSIEEEDEVLIDRSKDSIRGETVTFARVAPIASNIPRKTAQSSGRPYHPLAPLTDEELSPVEGLVIHDQDYHKGGGARPRSVSYSSLSQSLNHALPWRGNVRHNRTEYDRLQDNHSHQSEPINYSKPEQIYSEPAKIYSEAAKVYGEPSKVYSEPAKVYSEPAKVYSAPEKFYSEPSKIYSEPARIYSEPSKVYSKPSKVYSEPSKVYGVPSKVYSHSGNEAKPITPSTTTTTPTTTTTTPSTTTTGRSTTSRTASVYYSEHHQSPVKKVIFNLDKLPYDLLNAPASEEENNSKNYLFAPHLDAQRFHHFNRKAQDQQFQSKHQLPPSSQHHRTTADTRDETTHSHHLDWTPEPNYDHHPPSPTFASNSQSSTSSPPADDPPDADADDTSDDEVDPKVGFVVEGRNYRKYRVEEKTPDGFIVGEYGVVSNNDGSLRGVRYTADSNISPNLIYEALMKFLSL